MTSREQTANELSEKLASPAEGEFASEDEAMSFAIEQVRQFRKEKKKESRDLKN